MICVLELFEDRKGPRTNKSARSTRVNLRYPDAPQAGTVRLTPRVPTSPNVLGPEMEYWSITSFGAASLMILSPRWCMMEAELIWLDMGHSMHHRMS